MKPGQTLGIGDELPRPTRQGRGASDDILGARGSPQPSRQDRLLEQFLRVGGAGEPRQSLGIERMAEDRRRDEIVGGLRCSRRSRLSDELEHLPRPVGRRRRLVPSRRQALRLHREDQRFTLVPSVVV
ncbi:MAG: hypothetical protein AAGC60_24855 [Acidobacteriota bacterium]